MDIIIIRKYQEKETGRKAVKLPSTSPANAAFSVEKLTRAWKEICVPLQVAPTGIGEVLLDWYDYNAFTSGSASIQRS